MSALDQCHACGHPSTELRPLCAGCDRIIPEVRRIYAEWRLLRQQLKCATGRLAIDQMWLAAQGALVEIGAVLGGGET